MFEDIEQEVITWHRKTFKNATMEAMVDKFAEELEELEDAFMDEPKHVFIDNSAEEFVDMCIVFMAARAKLRAPSLASLIRDKLEINKDRVWGKETETGDRPRDKKESNK